MVVKTATNTFLATKVIFFNELKEICDAGNINFDNIQRLLNHDPRIGRNHRIVPGPDKKLGFGGSCFPKDINALISFARDFDVEPLLLDSVWSKNLMIRENYEWEELAQVTGDYDVDV